MKIDEYEPEDDIEDDFEEDETECLMKREFTVS